MDREQMFSKCCDYFTATTAVCGMFRRYCYRRRPADLLTSRRVCYVCDRSVYDKYAMLDMSYVLLRSLDYRREYKYTGEDDPEVRELFCHEDLYGADYCINEQFYLHMPCFAKKIQTYIKNGCHYSFQKMSSKRILDEFRKKSVCIGAADQAASQRVTKNFMDIPIHKIFEIQSFRIAKTQFGDKVIVTLQHENGDLDDRWAFPNLSKLFVETDKDGNLERKEDGDYPKRIMFEKVSPYVFRVTND